MGWIRRLFPRTVRKNPLNEQIDREIAFHIDQLTKENIAAGMAQDEARRQALVAFGGERQIAEECRRMHTISWVDDLVHDFRFGWRMLIKSPGYTTAAILALSLGIGPNTALFSIF